MPHTNPIVTEKIKRLFWILVVLSLITLPLVLIFSHSDGYETNTIIYLLVIYVSYFLYFLMLYYCDKTTHLQRMLAFTLIIMNLLCTIIFIILYYTDSYIKFGLSSLWFIVIYQLFTVFFLIKPCNAVVKYFSYNLNSDVYDEESQDTHYVSKNNDLDSNSSKTAVTL